MSVEMKDKSLKSHLTTYKMKLTTLSPIFIGGGEESVLNKTQYILDERAKKIHILDERKWASFLKQKKLFDAYLDFSIRFAISQKSKRGQPPPRYQGGLDDWLREKGHNYNTYKECIKYTVDAKNVNRGHDLRCFIKNVDMQPYIPGSSIKGAIRSAVLLAMVKHKQKELRAKYWNKLKTALVSGQKRDANKVADQLEKELLYTVIYKKTDPNRTSPINDIFKGIIVSDSTPIKPEHLIIIAKQDLSTHGGKNNNFLKAKLPIYREYLKPKTECYFTLTLDSHIINQEALSNLKNIENCLLTLSNFLLEEEKGLYDVFWNTWDGFYFPDYDFQKEGDLYPNLCIGGGSGFHSKVITYALAPSIEEANETLKRYFDATFKRKGQPIHKHVQLDKKASPRTLKLADYNGQYHIVGWCDIRRVQSIC